ncbi:MAG TPA: DUF4440 domain-containing protein, partial [Dehalococcoidia bacterium]|nr:DUF4440 domain-containing protein [Dehalococcoidia bacterium]
MTTAQADLASAIRALDNEFVRHAAAKDTNRLVDAFYAEDAVILAPNQPPIAGKPQIRGFVQGMLDAGLASISLEATKISGSGDLAYSVGEYQLTFRPAGAGAIQDEGKYVVVYRRQADGSWRAVAD